MSKKKEKEEVQEVEATEIAVEPAYTDVTYCPVYNETFKRYDMLKIYVNGPTGEVVKVEREATRYDTKARATHDLMSRLMYDAGKK